MFDLNVRDLGRTRDIQKACLYMLSFSRWRCLVDSRSGNKKQSQLIKKSLQIGGAKIDIFKYEDDIWLKVFSRILKKQK